MQTINLKQIIKDLNLSKNDIADELFPAHKFPKLALKRILGEQAVLDADQISRLSFITGIPIGELYASPEFRMESEEDEVRFTIGEFKAILNTKTGITKIYDGESLFHDSLINPGPTQLSVYLNEINTLITKHKSNEQSKN